MACALSPRFLPSPRFPSPANSGRIPLAELRDKIEGGWAGQMIGVSYGAPTEFRFNEQMISGDKLPVWKPEVFRKCARSG